MLERRTSAQSLPAGLVPSGQGLLLRRFRLEVRTSPRVVHGTALARLAKGAARDRADGNGLIDGQSLVEAQG
jgi:hypothetical protein